MRKLLKLLLVASLFTGITSNVNNVSAMEDEPKNLVVNWDFESTDSNSVGWENNKNGFICDGVSYGNGKKSGIVPSGCADGYVGQYVQGLEKNTTYKVTVQAKVDKPGGKAILATRVFTDNPWENDGDNEKKKQILKETYITSTEWKEYSYEFTTCLDTNKVFVSLIKWTSPSDGEYEAVKNCNAYIDNVVIEKAPSVTLPDESEYNEVWKDDFSGDKLDLTKWSYETGYVRNNELQEYVASEDNVFVKDGNLVLRATKKDQPVTVKGHRLYFNSGSIETFGHQDVLYGKIEMRAQLVNGKGFWPAFWTLGFDRFDGKGWPDCGEIDIMEAPVLSSDGVNYDSHATLHYGNKTDRPWFPGCEGVYTHSENLANDYHVYGINWTPEKIQWYFDDEIFYEWDITDNDYFHKPHFIKLNLAVGGNWPGEPNDLTQFPTDYKVDYVSYSQTEEQAQASEEFYEKCPQISGVKDIIVSKGASIIQAGNETGINLLEGITAKDSKGASLDVKVSTLPKQIDTSKVGETMLVYTSIDSNGIYGRAYATLKVVDKDVDKMQLKDAIDKVKELKETNYTKDSWSIVEKALEAANIVLFNNNATQTEIDLALEALNNAVDKLVKSDTSTGIIDDNDKNTDNSNDSTNSGNTTNDTPSVITGDTNEIQQLLIMMFVSLSVFGIIFYKKKQKASNNF